MLFHRTIKKRIVDQLFKWKTIILYGPRQVGKTTLVKEIIADHENSLYLSCDSKEVNTLLSIHEIDHLNEHFWSLQLLVLDEAQSVENIGLTLKLIHDHIPSVQVVATGSSSFELANKTNEPLTWRKRVFHLYPILYSEYKSAQKPLSLGVWDRHIHHQMQWGWYPEVLTATNKQLALTDITESYLYKDIFMLADIKKPAVLKKLVLALAYQIWSEVSINELAKVVGADSSTIENYLTLLEQSYIIFSLRSLRRNLRNEIVKKKKYYFWDCWIRNAIVWQFQAIENRLWEWRGALRENFFIAERMKLINTLWVSHSWPMNTYFRRTTWSNSREIDYVEEQDMRYTCYECKRNPDAKYKFPKAFDDGYTDLYEFHKVSPQNANEFLLPHNVPNYSETVLDQTHH